MGDNNEEAKTKEEVKDIVLTVTVKGDSGQMHIHAPGDGKVYDEPMCFWLLERAKDHIKMANLAAMKSKIITPDKQPFYRNVFKGK